VTGLPGIAALLADPLLTDVLAGGREGLLLLDYDGTLAPFAAQRDRAVPYPGVVDLLSLLPRQGSGRFAVASGRPAGDVLRLLAPAVPSEVWGCHGAERLVPGVAHFPPELPAAARAALDRARVLAVGIAGPDALEDKPVSLALHWRGLVPAARRELARRLRPAWNALARESGLILHPFDGGLELRLPGWDKGRAVRHMQQEYPGATLLYCGDDRTDEDAFTALGPTGLGVLVRARSRATAARYRISPPGELLRLLGAWASAWRGVNHQPGSCHA
jgi:trehalose 6-phosphate phosphatase